MGNATAWDIVIIFILLFVIFGRRLMPGMWRGLVRAVSGSGRSAAQPASAAQAARIPAVEETAGTAKPAEQPDDFPISGGRDTSES
ncbi:MAG: hypothetical protein LBV79_08060 [Candidatus Adiutrix sp.]|jgi:Sec-independent protein translocase protein TatA|nr:hypothetical protein [Candidatus Adiutrix sp.]